MSPFTLAYIGRLELWGLAGTVVQGMLVWLSWQAWQRVVPLAKADRRHRLACAHFAALAILPVLSVTILHGTIAETGTGAATKDVAEPVAGAWWALPLAGAWLAGFVAMAVRLVVDVGRAVRLRGLPAPGSLVECVGRLARVMGVAVPAVRTADLVTPQVVGLRRPLLLVPHAFARGMSTHERDAVLLHELAHVRRGDFGWNLLQRAMLVALWFQPAAWLLYRHLSQEREARCDVMAVLHGASPIDLSRALIRIAETPARPGLSMAAATRGGLTLRVHRLLGVIQVPAASRGWRTAALVLPVLGIAALSAGRFASGDAAIREVYLASAFGPTIAIEARDASGAFGLKVKQGQVVEASVENRVLPGERIVQQGDRVVLMGDAREPVVALTISPQGRIRWDARR